MIQPIEITDNSEKQGSSFEGFQKENYENLLHIANFSIDELCKNNPGLLVFPKNLNINKDEIDKHRIFSMQGSFDNLKSLKITTGNLMGFVGYGNTKVTIRSRFSKKSITDFFLHYMIQKVFAINLFDLPHPVINNGELDFLLYLFPNLLKKALSQGVYKAYKTFDRNDDRIKGAIEINRHIKMNEPFLGKIAYKSRESSFDNNVTQLIRHTIEYIKAKEYGNALLSADTDIQTCIKQILEATPSYSIKERERLINKNNGKFAHPFFSSYNTLLKLCLMILKHKKNNYGNNSNEVYGILFDGAWLWEEYLATILLSSGFKHAKNKEKKRGIEVYKGRMNYPDFYAGKQISCAETIPAENYILDAKYKHLDSTTLTRDDLNQIITYMHIFPSNASGLIYPYDKNTSDNSIIRYTSIHKLYGLGGTVETFGVPIPQEEHNQHEFRNRMKIIEEKVKSIQWLSR